MMLVFGGGGGPMAEVPEGWTDNLTIHIYPPQTLEELVEFVLQAEVRKVPLDATTTAVCGSRRSSRQSARSTSPTGEARRTRRCSRPATRMKVLRGISPLSA